MLLEKCKGRGRSLARSTICSIPQLPFTVLFFSSYVYFSLIFCFHSLSLLFTLQLLQQQRQQQSNVICCQFLLSLNSFSCFSIFFVPPYLLSSPLLFSALCVQCSGRWQSTRVTTQRINRQLMSSFSKAQDMYLIHRSIPMYVPIYKVMDMMGQFLY